MASAAFSGALAADPVSLRVLVPEHWQIVKAIETHDRDSVVPRRLWFYDMVMNFEKKHPEIKLELEATPWEHVTSIFTNKSLAGDPPDITFLPNGAQYKLAAADYLYPLGDFKFDWQDYNANILRENMSVDGKIYLVPNYTVPFVLYYNKALFAEAGITDVPNDWPSLIDAAQKLTRDTDGDGKIDVWGLGLPAGSVHAAQVYQNVEVLTWLLGGQVAADGRALIDTPEMVKALQFYVDLVHKYKVMPRTAVSWDKEYMSQFRNGQIAMTILGAEEYVPSAEALGDKVGVARIPAPNAADPQYTWTEIFGFVMSKKAGETKPDAAFAFLEEFASPETFLLAAEYQKGLPTRVSVAANPVYKQDPLISFLADYVVDSGRADPYMEEFEAWGDIVARAVEAAVLQIGTPEDLLKTAQAEYDARLGR